MLARAFVIGAVLVLIPRTLVCQTSVGALILKNTAFDSVRVEVRVGPSNDCASNALAGVIQLQRHQRWAIATGDVVCWRREVRPGAVPVVQTDWVRRRIAAGTKQEEVL